MKRGVVVFSVVAASIGAFLLGRAGAEDAPAGPGADEMAAWMALAEPGAEHEMLQQSVGTWDCEVKTWQQPGAEPTVEKGQSVRTEALGGRFIKETYKGHMMGHPFEGRAYSGFNNATKKYELVWMDTWGTGIMFMTGTETEPGKVWTYKGSFFGPGGMEVRSRSVVRKISDDKSVMEMFNDMGAGEMKCMEITYTRAK